MKLRLIAAAKINWTLEALGRRDDGYHEIRTIIQTVALHDTVVLSPAETLELRLAGAVPSESWLAKDDLAYRAAEALREQAGDPSLGALVELEKAVPAAAGLGGGSSDAAAVLRGLNRLWRLDFGATHLARIAASLGSDVPFFLAGGTAMAGGRGDEVAALPDVPSTPLLIAVPRDRLPQKTALMYRRLRAEHYTSGERADRQVEKLNRAPPSPTTTSSTSSMPFSSSPCRSRPSWRRSARRAAPARISPAAAQPFSSSRRLAKT